MASKLHSVVLRAPGIYGLNFEGEAVQKTPEYAKLADNVAYDASGRLCNRKGFSPTSAKEATEQFGKETEKSKDIIKKEEANIEE